MGKPLGTGGVTVHETQTVEHSTNSTLNALFLSFLPQPNQHVPFAMFKKPLASLKSFSPLRSSDKRRLRDEILATYPVLRDMEPINDTPIAAIITPEGLQSAKFVSHIEEPGTLYTDAEGTPLWFKIGAGRNDSIVVPTGTRALNLPRVDPASTYCSYFEVSLYCPPSVHALEVPESRPRPHYMESCHRQASEWCRPNDTRGDHF